MYCESRYATHHVTHHVIPPVPRLTLVTYGSCETVPGPRIVGDTKTIPQAQNWSFKEK